MRFETVDALTLLVSTYTTSIESAGVVIPEDTVALIGTDPFKACEALNELAVACHALTPEVDSALAAIYESMDAADARSLATTTVCERAQAAFERVHIEQPEPEPEPEPEPAAESADADGSTDETLAETLFDTEPAETPTEAPAEQSEPSPRKAAKEGAPAFEGDVLSVDQALAILGCSRPKLTKLIESGELPAYKKGRSWQISATAVLDRAAGN